MQKVKEKDYGGKMLGNPKNAFWEAFLLAVVVFILGLLLGVAYETSRYQEMNQYYVKSELALMDVFAFSNLIDVQNTSCNQLVQYNIDFANRIYDEAVLLENYEKSGKITDETKLAHKKYDLMRTLLWIDVIKTREKCSQSFDSVVYLYEYNTNDLDIRATQNVWSKVLYDLKQEKGDKIILISIAVDNPEIRSIQDMSRNFNISKYPAVVINDKTVITDLSSASDLEKYLD
ncbi:Uncharacterised protein [uncultured archaeon]|nr:Uncharacterised protein [uncultured archaeon]